MTAGNRPHLPAQDAAAQDAAQDATAQEARQEPAAGRGAPRLGLSKTKLRVFALLTVALGLCVGFLLVEAAVRVLLSMRPNDIETLRRFEHAKRAAAGGNLTLIHFIRPSRNPALVYELIPGAEGLFRGVPVKINSAGFRDAERAAGKPPGTFRIAMIGDSIVFGWGVRQEERFSDLLERFLNETSPEAAKPFEALNFGVPGYNTVMEAEQLRHAGMKYEPDAVVLSFVNDNDADVPNFLAKPRQLLSLRRSYALEMLRTRSLRKQRMELEGGVQGADRDNVPPEYHYLLGWGNVRRALGDIRDMCTARGIPVVFRPDYWTVEPWRGASAQPLEQDSASEIIAYAQERGYLLADPKPEMLRYLDAQRWHSYALCVAPDDNDAHPNAVGHALIAKILYKRLVESGVLPDSSARQPLLSEHLKRWDEIIARAAQSAPIAEKYKTPGD